MADIAAAVEIAPSALYRHFGGKQELLLAILEENLRRLEQLVAAPGPGLLDDLAAFALDHREFGIIWKRESAHLPDEQQRALRHRLRAVSQSVAARAGLDGTEADLRAWALLSVISSPSHYHVDTARDRFEWLLRAAERAVLAVPLPDVPTDAPDAARPARPRPLGLSPVSRREALLSAAIGLFRERGYPSVCLTDIGAAVGIAGPSVYNHFASKDEILDAALSRGAETMWLGLSNALAAAEDPADALERAVADYAAFAVANPGMIRLVVTELIHLPEDLWLEKRRTQLNFVAEWIALLSACRPDLTSADTRILVQTSFTVINGLSRIPHLAPRPSQLAALACAVLGAGQDSDDGSEAKRR
jgi:AcrR family transcriptional regulator